MSYKIYLFDALDAVEWSQVAWKLEGRVVSTEDCEIEFIHDVMLRHLPKQGRIVDAGCGVARWPIYLRRLGYDVLGVEYSHDACAIARENDGGLDVMRGDVRHMPLQSDSVDGLLSLGVVEHDESGPQEALREAHRVLKPGGVMILAVPFNNLLRRLVTNHLFTRVTEKRRHSSWKLGFAEYRFTRDEVRRFLEESDFEIVDCQPNDLHPPKNMGLWVDYNNLIMNPLKPSDPDKLFILDGWKGKLAAALTRWTPWLVCGEVVFVARKKPRNTQKT